MSTTTLRAGQVIAIPVLTRHLKTSSGKCATHLVGGESKPLPSDCVMADALRDRFPDAEYISVASGWSDMTIDGYSVSLRHEQDMHDAIDAFDDAIDRTNQWAEDPIETVDELVRNIRAQIPRVVHATVVTDF